MILFCLWFTQWRELWLSPFPDSDWLSDLSKVMVSGGGNLGRTWPIIWLIQENGSCWDFFLLEFSAQELVIDTNKNTHFIKMVFPLDSIWAQVKGSYVHTCLHSSSHVFSFFISGVDEWGRTGWWDNLEKGYLNKNRKTSGKADGFPLPTFPSPSGRVCLSSNIAAFFTKLPCWHVVTTHKVFP